MQELMNITLGHLLEQVAAEYPDNIAVKYTDRDYCRTWKEFDEEVNQVAKAFIALGIGKDDKVAIWAPNIPEWILTLYASAKIGAVLVTVNTAYKVFEAEYLLRQSDTKLLVLSEGYKDTNYLEIIDEICPELKASIPGCLQSARLPELRGVISVDCAKHEGVLDWKELFSMGQNLSAGTFRTITDALCPEDVVNIQYTSGTTGFPKGVMLTHNNIINNGKTIGDGMAFTPNDRLCICVPFFHCFGLVLAMMSCITHATTMVPVKYYKPLDVMEALQKEQCTAVHGVPTMFISMLEHPSFSQFDFSSMRTGIMAGSPCPIKVMQDVIEKMNMRDIVIVYGQTEASPGCTMTTTSDSVDKRVATVGRSFPGVETKIVDPETGETLGPNVQGEFCARGYNVMRGYYKMEEATKQAIDQDGWLHSGDLAMVDEDGYYKITGRIKDMIIRGGENIYPKEIEEFIYTIDGVKDVQVIGVPSQKYGEEICACVILREDAHLTAEDIQQQVAANMAKHKVPSYVAFMDEFIMTASGKIQKFKMREWAIEKFGLQDAASIETA